VALTIKIKAKALIIMGSHMFKKLRAFLLSLILISSFNQVFAADIPIIVISPGKSAQSLSTVGSTVEVITGDQINNSSKFSLPNVIDDNSLSTNMFQAGGHGANTGIQLRGLEKKYSTVYIDGVKMLDPSSSDGSFYLENVMKNGIDRVEILKGTQSSLYGSNAIGGTINIFTKKGREGKHSDYSVETASKGTGNLTYSIDGADDKLNYFIGVNKFYTDGISAMNDNDEEDQYKNENVVGNVGYKINDELKIENSFRLSNSFFEYDEVASATNDKDTGTKNLEGSVAVKLIHEKNKFKNTFSYNKLHIERHTQSNTSAGKKANYFGYRDAFNFLGEYNFNLDNRIVYGIDSEFDAARYYKGSLGFGSANKKHDEGVISQYFDVQFRPLDKLYSTFGLRSDDHDTAGRKSSGRFTTAYLLDGNSKIRSSLGTGLRFPSLYAYGFGDTDITDEGGTFDGLKAERGLSFDLGYDTFLTNLDLGLNITYFKLEQKNSLFSNARTGWVTRNGTGRNTSEGVEVGGNWKPIDSKFGLNFGYTFTDTYDANTCDPDELAAFTDKECRGSGKLAKAKVRVPRHAFQSQINYFPNLNLQSSLRTKFTGQTRDFGNTNNGFTDVILDHHLVFDLANSYKLPNGYKLHFNINNLFDEAYEQAYQYSSMGRNLNIGIRRAF
jgi:vitamin B12 transporter